VDRVCAVPSQHHRFNQIRQRLEIFGLAVFDLRDPIAASLPRNQRRISGEERIDQRHMAGDIEPEHEMAEPGDLRGGRPLPRRGSGPVT
jgi:hypothetical protein